MNLVPHFINTTTFAARDCKEMSEPIAVTRNYCYLYPAFRVTALEAVIRANTEQASKGLTWEPTRQLIGEGRRRWGKTEVVESPSHRTI